MTDEVQRALDAVWRVESARIVGALTKVAGDLSVAEDAAQEALVEALRAWRDGGVPANPGAWLTTVARRRLVDRWRRAGGLDERYRALARGLDDSAELTWEPIDDDVLRLIFISCHPVLSRESQVALTLRVVAGLSTAEIARLLLVSVPTAQARITRAKKSLSAAAVPFETPEPSEWGPRLSGVLGVAYLMFTEGYSATSGDRWVRPDLAEEALRLARRLAALVPREPEAHGLVALLELQASRFAARTRPDGTPILLADQDRRRWDHAQILRGRAALARADSRGRGRGPYAIQAAIAEQHAIAPSVADTDWDAIVVLYEVLGRIAPNPVVELNRAVAVAMAGDPAAALAIVDGPGFGALQGSHLIPSARGELLARLGRRSEARAELLAAASLTDNTRIRANLVEKADGL